MLCKSAPGEGWASTPELDAGPGVVVAAKRRCCGSCVANDPREALGLPFTRIRAPIRASLCALQRFGSWKRCVLGASRAAEQPNESSRNNRFVVRDDDDAP